MTSSPAITSTVGIIAGSGVLPFAAAESLRKQGIKTVLFALRGFCDEARVAEFPHHWISLGQLGRLTKLLRAEGCADVMFLGGLVRPSLKDFRLDWETIRAIPEIRASLKGGDDAVLAGAGRVFEKRGFRLIGIADVAPDLLMPEGNLTRAAPDADASADIAKGRELLKALGPFDVGQAVVVVDGHAIGVEGIEGTDDLLARVKRLRDEQRLRVASGRGVLVKMPKSHQDLRFDLPALGPKTVDGVAAAGLAGIAAVANQTLIAEPQRLIARADDARLFVTGLRT